jgi:hypothetical protein
VTELIFVDTNVLVSADDLDAGTSSPESDTSRSG